MAFNDDLFDDLDDDLLAGYAVEDIEDIDGISDDEMLDEYEGGLDYDEDEDFED